MKQLQALILLSLLAGASSAGNGSQAVVAGELYNK